MRILQEAKGINEQIEFTFEHSKDYQNIQFAFLDAVESLDHNNIIVRNININFKDCYLIKI